MKIGLIDVDGHNFPNLALMRISAYHKAQGDEVEWWKGDLFYYDKVYKSKIFSDTYSQDLYDPMNCGEVISGGTGYCISNRGGREVFDKSKDTLLPNEVESMFPDYSIYPEYDYAVAMTSRGCPRGCAFCHVAAKEGRRSHKVADVKDFWNGQKHIEVLDPNITACPDKHELFEQYIDTGAEIVFNQGLDIRLLTDKDIEYLNRMKVKNIHFAWDNAEDGLYKYFADYAKQTTHKYHGGYGTVYVLTNFNSTMEQNLFRIYTLRGLGYDPFVMVYDKPNAPQEVKRLQRWCNNKIIFKSTQRFEEYIAK